MSDQEKIRRRWVFWSAVGVSWMLLVSLSGGLLMLVIEFLGGDSRCLSPYMSVLFMPLLGLSLYIAYSFCRRLGIPVLDESAETFVRRGGETPYANRTPVTIDASSAAGADWLNPVVMSRSQVKISEEGMLRPRGKNRLIRWDDVGSCTIGTITRTLVGSDAVTTCVFRDRAGKEILRLSLGGVPAADQERLLAFVRAKYQAAPPELIAAEASEGTGTEPEAANAPQGTGTEMEAALLPAEGAADQTGGRAGRSQEVAR